MKILPRGTWTTTKNGRAGRTLLPSEVTAITVHYPGSGNVTLKNQTQAQIAARLRGYRDLHISAPRNWADIGYNYAVDGQGRVWDLTGLNRGAHAGTAAGNRTSVGVLLIVGNKETPPPEMLTAFRDLRAWIITKLPGATRVRPHSSWVGTECPGDKLRALIANGTLTQEDDMPLSDDDIQRIAKAVWTADLIAIEAPVGTEESRKKNPTWQARSVLTNLLKHTWPKS